MLYKREKYLKRIRPFYESEDIIKVITGVRRCGKSCLMKMIEEELISHGETEGREYKPLEKIKDNYTKYVATTDYALQKRNGILHINIIDYMMQGKTF